MGFYNNLNYHLTSCEASFCWKNRGKSAATLNTAILNKKCTKTVDSETDAEIWY